jgi:hypothetical protein
VKGTLANPDDKARLLIRLRQLGADSPRQWGTMTPHEAICHLSDSFLAVSGQRSISHVDTLFTRTLLKWIALHGPGKWPQGIRTRPEVNPRLGGTKPGDFVRDRERLEHVMEQFARAEQDFAAFRHPAFGHMSRHDWWRWGWLHVDHHLRQFGA